MAIQVFGSIYVPPTGPDQFGLAFFQTVGVGLSIATFTIVAELDGQVHVGSGYGPPSVDADNLGGVFQKFLDFPDVMDILRWRAVIDNTQPTNLELPGVKPLGVVPLTKGVPVSVNADPPFVCQVGVGMYFVSPVPACPFTVFMQGYTFD